jgi:hypothetical protein
MRLRYIILALFLPVGAIFPAFASSAEHVSDDDLLSRISLSFSKIPFNIQARDVKINLAEAPYISCESPWNCRFEDADFVDHKFGGAEGRLVGKSLSAHHFDKKPIGALGIGLLRQKTDVLKQISVFLGEADYTCKDVPTIMAGGKLRYSGNTACTWELSKGYVSAGFDAQEQFSYARFWSDETGGNQ